MTRNKTDEESKDEGTIQADAEKQGLKIPKVDDFCCVPRLQPLIRIIKKRKTLTFGGVEGYYFAPHELGILLSKTGDPEWGNLSEPYEVYCDDCVRAIFLTPEYIKKCIIRGLTDEKFTR